MDGLTQNVPPFPDGMTPQQASDLALQAINANQDVIGAVHTALVQPIGSAINGNKKTLSSIDRRVNKVANGLTSRNAQLLGDVQGTVAVTVRQFIDANADVLQGIGNLAATGAPVAPVVSVGPPQPAGVSGLFYVHFLTNKCQFVVDQSKGRVPLPNVPNPFTSFGAAEAWIMDHGQAWIQQYFPQCLHGAGAPVAPTAGGLPAGTPPTGTYYWYQFECEGHDGKPAWALWEHTALGATVVAVDCISIVGQDGIGTSNYDGTKPQQTVGGTSSDCKTTSAAAIAAFPAFAASCGGGTPPPPPTPPPPFLPPPVITPPPPVTTPPPCVPPPSGESCPPPTDLCITEGQTAGPCAQLTIPNILVIGSPEFIAAKPTLVDALVKLSDLIIGMIKDFSSFQSATVMFPVDSSTTAGKLVSALWGAIQGWFSKATQDSIKQIKEALSCWYQAMVQSQGCNLGVVARLAVVRGFIEVLQRFRIGWDLAIWGTLDVTVHIDPLLKVLNYLIDDACPAELPGFGDIIEGWLRGGMPDDRRDALLRFQGIDKDVWHHTIRSRRERLQVWEFIQYQRRLGVDDKTIQDELRSYGFLTDRARAARLEMSYELPSISDHLHWLQRNVFDLDYVRTYNLLDGFAPDADISQLLGAPYQSLPTQFPKPDFWATFGHDLHALGLREKYAALHYAAHWVNPAPGQLAEMMIRLRPGRVDPAVAFTQQDFLRVLAEQDVAPYFRQRFLAIAFRVLPLRQLNQAAQQGRFDLAELTERWKDIGFNAVDADLMARTLLVQAARAKASLGKGYTPAVVAKLSAANLIDKQTANDKLNPQGFSAADVDTLFEVAGLLEQVRVQEKYDALSIKKYADLAVKAYSEGAVDRDNAYGALIRAGFTDQAANLTLATADLDQQRRAVAVAVRSIHKARLLGEVDNSGALAALQTIGVPSLRANQYVQQWALELTVPRISASTARIMAWMKKGLLSIANGAQRLVNLGWNPPDIQLMVLEVQQYVELASKKANATAAKQLKQAQKDAQTAIDKSQAACRRIYPIQRQVAFYAKRIIDKSTLAGRLSSCGHSADVIANAEAEAEVRRAALDEKAAKNGATGIEYTGQGADTS